MEISLVRTFVLHVVCSFIFIYIAAETETLYSDISPDRLPRDETTEKNESLIVFLQRVVKKHGEKKVAASIYELAQKSMYELMWMLAGDLDGWIAYDLYKVYSYAQADQDVLTVFERFRTGNVDRSIVPIVFELDKKYNQFTWWQRVRTRMLENTEKYIAGTLNPQQVHNTDSMFGQLALLAQQSDAENLKINANKGKDKVVLPDVHEEDEEDIFFNFLTES